MSRAGNDSRVFRVLHVDDCEDDHILLKMRLHKSHKNFDLVWSHSAKAALELLDSEQFDCVLSDYQMPGMNGFELLKTLKQDELDIPFIFFTGHGSEEVAANALREGAHDYFTKDLSIASIDRLANSITRHAIAKKYERDLHLSNRKFELLIKNIPMVTWITNLSGNTTFISPNVVDVYGYTPEEIYASGDNLFFGRIHPDDVDRVKRTFTEMLQRNGPFEIEYRIKHKRGHWIWLHDRGLLISDTGDEPVAIGVFADVTKSKGKEEQLARSELKYRTLFQMSGEAMATFRIDRESKEAITIDCNEALLSMLGVADHEEALDLKPWDFSPELQSDGKQSVQKAKEMIARLLNENQISFEWDHKRMDGTVFPCEITMRKYEIGDDIYFHSIVRDKTKKKNNRRS